MTCCYRRCVRLSSTRRAASTFLFLLAAPAAAGCRHPEARRPEAQKVIVEPTPKAAVSEGSKAPLFALPSLTTSGQATLVSGSVVLVYFWATWNGPCKNSFPRLQALYAQYASRGFAIAALSVDDEPKGVAEAATSWGAKFPVAWDREHQVASEWGPSHMPSLYLVDRNGVIRHVEHGWHDGQEKDLEKALAALL